MSKKSKKKLKLKKDYSLLLKESGLAPKPNISPSQSQPVRIASSSKEEIVDLALVRKDLLLSLYTFLGIVLIISIFKLLSLKVFSIEDLGSRLFRLLNIG